MNEDIQKHVDRMVALKMSRFDQDCAAAADWAALDNFREVLAVNKLLNQEHPPEMTKREWECVRMLASNGIVMATKQAADKTDSR